MKESTELAKKIIAKLDEEGQMLFTQFAEVLTKETVEYAAESFQKIVKDAAEKAKDTK
jgi:hypothetical protein